ncbi:50S ribosomal protein L16 [Candidatus Uhrbacteria bacterium]|nr:50S ribosomal protein L16 [Candidatus Uhrbacteria bacterium]
MLLPKSVKYRKMHKNTKKAYQVATTKTTIAFGMYGLKAQTSGWVTSRQIEAARRAMMHYLKRGGKVWIRIFPDKPVTTKGAEVPMGGGKGAVDHYVAVVRPGTILFEIDGVDEKTAAEAIRLAKHKLPVRSNFIAKAL